MVDGKRTHEIRIGMSLYWAETWPAGEGWSWSTKDLGGWVVGSRADAIADCREALRAHEAA